MSRVNILSPEIISKIAAGEVIERPASVIKELLENSLDAGSDKVDILIKQAGSTLIYLKDNGHGIHKDDLEKAFLRHATSKISRINDLFHISSLGFRGEALYTIGAVSDIILRSRTAEDETGWEIHMRGGKKLNFKPVAMQPGTEIEVKELFFNTPARRKFLKTPATEFKQILNTVIPHTLVHTNCAFTLSHENKALKKNVLALNPEKTTANRIANTLNVDPVHIIECANEIPHRRTKLRAFLGDSNIRRTSKDMQFIFINNRPVSSRLLNYQINDMYKALFPSDIYPLFVLYLDIPAEDIDANIHPTKKEVKINNEYDLFIIIRSMCEEILLNQTKAKQIETSPFKFSKNTDSITTQTYQPPAAGQQQQIRDKQVSFNLRRTNASAKPVQSTEYMRKATETIFTSVDTNPIVTIQTEIEPLRAKLEEAYFIGVFKKKYIIYGTENSVLLLDQHAAQERITFETLKKQINNEELEIQNLLTPYSLRLSPAELLAWEENEEALTKLGFSTSKWDNETIAIHSHPQLIQAPDIAVRNLLAGNKIEKCNTETIARRACRKSIMAGDSIDKNSAEKLRENLLNCAEPFTCPHGRPTLVEMQESFINRQFLRS